MGKKTFITFFLNVLKNIQLKPKKPKKTQKTQHPKWDFKLILGFLGFLGLNPPLVLHHKLENITFSDKYFDDYGHPLHLTHEK